MVRWRKPLPAAPCETDLYRTYDFGDFFIPHNAVALAGPNKVFMLQDYDTDVEPNTYVWTYPYDPVTLIATGTETLGAGLPHSSPAPSGTWDGSSATVWNSTSPAADGGLLVAGYSQHDPGAFLIHHAMLWHVTSGGTVSTIYDGYPVGTSNKRETTRVVEHEGTYYCSVLALVNQPGVFSNEVWSIPGGTFYPNATTDMGGLNAAVSGGGYVWAVGGALNIVRWDPATDTTTVTASGLPTGYISALAYMSGRLVVAWTNNTQTFSQIYTFNPANIGAGGTFIRTANFWITQMNPETDTGLLFYYSSESGGFHYAVELCLGEPPCPCILGCPIPLYAGGYGGPDGTNMNGTSLVAGGSIDADGHHFYVVDENNPDDMYVGDLDALPGMTLFYSHGSGSFGYTAPGDTTGTVYTIHNGIEIGVISGGSYSMILDKTGATLSGGWTFSSITDLIWQPNGGNLYVLWAWAGSGATAGDTRFQVVKVTTGGTETVVIDEIAEFGVGGVEIGPRALTPTLDGGVWFSVRRFNGGTQYEVWRTNNIGSTVEVVMPNQIVEMMPAPGGTGVIAADNLNDVLYYVTAEGYEVIDCSNLVAVGDNDMVQSMWSPTQDRLIQRAVSGLPDLWEWEQCLCP